MQKNKFFIKVCNDLILLSDYSATIHKKINHFFEKNSSNSIPKEKNITRANKCYLVLLSPLIIVLIFSLSKTMFSWMFIKNMTLFFDEYVKLILLIPIFILLFTWIFPSLFFKLFYPDEKIHISIYTYGILISIIFPLLVIPQDYHYYKGKSIEMLGTVIDKNTYRKSRSITFLTKESKLEKIKLRGLTKATVENTKISEQYLIKGNKSKFYFTYNNIILLKKVPNVYNTNK